MGVVSTPLKNDIAKQKDIFRLAATLYSETSDLFSTAEAQLQMVKCTFSSCENCYRTSSEIIVSLLDIYKYHISEDEVLSIIGRSKKTFQKISIDGNDAYKLTDEAYQQIIAVQKQNIDCFIDTYIREQNIVDQDSCKNAIHQYLYELTTTNINSYKVLLHGKGKADFSDKELSVNVDYLSDTEKAMVHDFLEWDNDEKNVALGDVVYCCLEYCLLVNGDTPNHLLKSSIRKREVYLDTNIIFRALGIDGSSRQRVVTAFLDKCKQARIKIIITYSSQREFFDTVGYYISQISLYPRGNVFDGAFEQITDYSIFAYYDSWHQGHSSLSLKYFSLHIKSMYAGLISKYNIIDGEKIPSTIYNTSEFKEKRNYYSASIKRKKQELKSYYIADDDSYSLRDSHDATVIRYIEILREKNNCDADIFFVSSDKALRFWDMTRKETLYPVVVYPSQLFLILIKLCGRSANDYDSFVSFINIRPRSKQITPEKANIILSGISSITEDVCAQEVLVSAVYGDEFQNIIQHSKTDAELYQQTQQFSQNYLQEQLKEKNGQIEAITATSSDKEQQIHQLQIDAKEQEQLLIQKQNDVEDKNKRLEKQREQICALAEKQILPKYYFRYYIVPVTITLLTFCFAVFIGLQFFFCDKSWNLAVLFYNWVKTTSFGQMVGDFVYVIDAVFCGINLFLLKKFMRNPFNKAKRNQEKADSIQKYIDEHDLN